MKNERVCTIISKLIIVSNCVNIVSFYTIPGKFFTPVVCFLIFNVGDFCGRVIAGFIQKVRLSQVGIAGKKPCHLHSFTSTQRHKNATDLCELLILLASYNLLTCSKPVDTLQQTCPQQAVASHEYAS